MSNIYLVRHCEYSNPNSILAGRLPLELSDEGLEQANILHNFFIDKNISKIYSSPVLRCKMTSEIISNENIPIEFDKRLAEVFSAMQGTKLLENMNGLLNYGYRHELGGESFEDIYSRMSDFWNSANFELDKNYIICSHGDPLYQLYQYLGVIEPIANYDFGKPKPVYNGYQEKGSVRIINLDRNGIVIGELIENSNL